MRFTRIEVKNFRNFRHLDIRTGRHAVIVGENKIGKSNLLFALRLVLDPSLPDSARQLRLEDFWDGLPRPLTADDRIEVSVELAEFDGNVDHLAVLGEYLVSPEPMVARLTYAFQPLPNLTGGPTKESDYEFTVYGGGRSECRVGYELRRRHPLDLLPALRDAEGDLSNWRKSPLRPLLDRAAGEIDRQRLMELADGVSEATRAIAGCDEVRAVGEMISGRLIEMVGSLHALEMSLGFSPSDGERLIRTLRLFIDGGVRSVADASLGSANLLYLALKSLELDQEVGYGERSHTFLAIEEPEAHLHPHVQRRVYRTFLRPRQPVPEPPAEPKKPSPEMTILLTTHSPNIVSVSPVHSLVLLRKAPDLMATEGVSTATLDLDPAEADDIERYLDVTRGELLFAKGVLLVEGEAEEYMLPVLAELNGYHLDELGVSVCSVAGTHFLPYLKFLGPNGLNIPCAVVTDADPGVRTTGLARIRNMLEHLAPDDLDGLTTDDDVIDLGKQRGLFLTADTFEVALFRAGRHVSFARTMTELSSSRVARRRAAGWKAEPATLDTKRMLKDIEGIGKGRFSQRWACNLSRSTSKQCPFSILERSSMLPTGSKLAPYLAAAEDLRRNKGQWAAYESKKHCVVLAGPGSGKTKVLTVKLARLLAEEFRSPRGVACLTYNNECARELTKRAAKLGVRIAPNVFIGTVHSFCLKAVLMPYARMAGLALPEPLRVATGTEQERVFTKALGRVVSADERPDVWRRRCDHYRRTYLDRSASDWRGKDPQLADLIEEYESLLRSEGFIDFDDMVLLGLRLIEAHPWVRRVLTARFPALVMDEYQDLGLTLHRLVLSVCFGSDTSCRLFAVGDPDQSIYSFTGAQPELLAKLADDRRVEKVRLLLNYRSRASIVSASEVALGERRGYEAASGDGGIIDFHKCKDGLPHQATVVCRKLIPAALAAGVARNLGEIAVLYRSKKQGDVVAEVAAAASYYFIRSDGNAPYRCTPFTTWLEQCAAWCVGGWQRGEPGLSDLLSRWRSFNGSVGSDAGRLAVGRKLVRFLMSQRNSDGNLGTWLGAFHSLCLNEAFDRESVLADESVRVTNLLGLCEPGKNLSTWSVAHFGGQGGSPAHLNLMTFHSAKGLEFDVVFMLGLDQGVIPGYGDNTRASKREPRRLFYVGLTRARYEVHMLFSGWRDSPYGRKYDGPSEFLLEVQSAVSLA